MNIGVLGTGMVGQTIATKLVQVGHEVTMGSRTGGNERATEWVDAVGPRGHQGTFADATEFGELIFTCIAGVHTLEALEASRRAQPRGQGRDRRRQPARLLAGHAADAVGLQHRLARRADPARLPRVPRREGAEHDELHRHGRPGCRSPATTTRSCAAPTTRRSRTSIEPARELRLAAPADPRPRATSPPSRGMEMYVALWLRLYGAVGGPHFNIAVSS